MKIPRQFIGQPHYSNLPSQQALGPGKLPSPPFPSVNAGVLKKTSPMGSGQLPSPPFPGTFSGSFNQPVSAAAGQLPSPPFPSQYGMTASLPSSALSTPPLPTGVPLGSPLSGIAAATTDTTGAFSATSQDLLPFSDEQPPQTMTSILYTPGFLRTQIGKNVRVEFLIGTNNLVDRFGTLVGVGASYILINEAETDDILLCDIYSIKFVKFYH